MRSERKRRRTFLARFMVLFMIINLLSGVNPSVVKADAPTDAAHFKDYILEKTDSATNIKLTQKAENYNDGTFDVEMTVESDEDSTTKIHTLDVVLAIDTSNSMEEKVGEAKRLDTAKKAAVSFVNGLILDGKTNVRVSVIGYGAHAYEVIGLSNKKADIVNAINRLTITGGTYTQDALKMSDSILSKSQADQKRIVLLSDGVPTYGYDGKNSGFDNAIETDNNITHPSYKIYHRKVTQKRIPGVGGFGKEEYGNFIEGYNVNKEWVSDGWFKRYRFQNYRVYPGRIGDGRKGSEIINNLLFSEANKIKGKDITITTVGIDVYGDGAKVLTEVAKNSGGYNGANGFGNNLKNILDKLAEEIINKRVNNGKFVIPMADFVKFKDNLTYEVTTKGEKNTILTNAIKATKPTSGNNNLVFSGLTLGKDDKLTVKYKAELVEERKDGDYYDITKTSPELFATATTNDKIVFDKIMKVKDLKTINLVVNKEWIGNNVPSGVTEVEFTVNANGQSSGTINVKANPAGNWSGTKEKLNRYKDGKAINYTVKEVAGVNYELKDSIKSVNDNNGDITFTATNRNTEKINFTVKKDWANTPEELKIGVAAKLYANGNLKATEPLNNDEAIFKDLPRYDEAGNEIKYTVKETLDVGGEEENGQITFGEYNYKVDYAYTESGATITNTSTNASKVKFDIDVIKNWVGGSSTQKLYFVFKNEKDGKESTLTMTAADQASQDRWSDSIELSKYNDDNSLAAYTVTEKNVKGYTVDVDKFSGITANSEPIEFTNTRNTRDITVTKQWKDTPENLKKDVEVVLTENGKDSSRRDAVKTIKNDVEHKVTYTNLPETDTDGNKIDYSVNENSVEAGFEATVTKKDDGNIVVTNTYKKLKEDTISVTLKKVWVGGEGNNATFNFINKKTKDAQTVVLSADTKDLNKNDDKNGHVTWTYEVKNLRKYDDDANLIDYVVEEVTNKAYTLKGANSVEVKAGDTATFTNVRVEKKLTLKKEWISEEKVPVTVNVAAGDINFDILLRKENGWKYDKLLPVYDLEGNPIQYTITEKEIQGYKADNSVKPLTFVTPTGDTADQIVTFTNTKMLEKPFTVHKTWVGEPASKVSFGLFDGTNKVDTLELSSKDVKAPAQTQAVWEGTFKGEYPEYKLVGGNAEKIQYEVKELDASGNSVSDEVKLEGRTFKVVGTSAQDTPNTYNFANTDITKTDISVTKTWVGKVPLPQLVKFGLYKETPEGLINVSYDTKIDRINASKWVVSYEDVPTVDEKGNKIKYVIKEVYGDTPDVVRSGDIVTLGNVNYKVSYDDKGNITNTELINLTVNKEWGKNVPEIAKQSVKFRITNDSRSDMNGKSFLLNDANGWTMSFKNLPLYNAEGKEINYTVVETEINGDEVEPGPSAKKYYHSAFEITAEDAENITKSQTVTIKNNVADANNEDPELRTINVVKGWSAGAERKPVTVKLYQLDAAKGEIVHVEGREAELREDTFWQAEFTVPKNDKDGNEIIYYAFETSVGDIKIDESKLNPNMYNEGYQIGEYEVSIAELTSDEEGAEIGNYGFFILNTAHNKEVKPEEKVTINVTKKWLVPTDSEYVKPVNVRLFTKKGEYLIPVSDVNDLTLDANNNWEGKFTDLDKYNDDEKEIEYYVAEVGIGDQTKEIINFADLFGYSIGRYNVTIDGNGTNDVVITNDIALIDVTAVKNWVGATPRQTVEFTLYTKQGENLVPTGKTVTLNGTDENTVATFAELPRLDNDGKQIVYYVYETKIGETPITFNLTSVETTNYSVGINGGVYAVTVSDNGTVGDKVVIISNSFTGTPVIPSGNIPLVPVVTPIPTPTPTPAPNPDSPVVDIPNVPSPQGPATPVNDGDEDNGVTEIDEDDVPQGDGKEVKKDNKANKDTVDITDNKAPKGTANLPKTGGEAGNFLSIIGLGLIGLGLVIRRRR